MLKYVGIFLVIMALVGLMAAPVMAQDPFDSPLPTPQPTVEPPPSYEWPEELPETAQEGLKEIESFLVFVGALGAYWLTRGIRRLPWLTDGEKSKINGLAAEAVAGLVALAIGFVLAYGGYAANFLDDNGFWQVVVWCWGFAFGIHKLNKFGKIAKYLRYIGPLLEKA